MAGTKYITSLTGPQIDTALSTMNAVRTVNGVVKSNGQGAFSVIPIDSTPTANSTNLVTSGGVKSAVDNAIPLLTLSQAQIISLNPVTIQLTNEQYAILAANSFICSDASALGLGKSGVTKYLETATNIYFSASNINNYNMATIIHSSLSIDKSTKICVLRELSFSAVCYDSGGFYVQGNS